MKIFGLKFTIIVFTKFIVKHCFVGHIFEKINKYKEGGFCDKTSKPGVFVAFFAMWEPKFKPPFQPRS